MSLAAANKAVIILDGLLVVAVVWLALEALPTRVAILLVVAGIASRMVVWRLALSSRSTPPAETRDLATVMRRNENQRRHAIRDEASGLYQRWYLELRLDEEAARCKRYGHDMAIVVVRAGLIDLSDWSFDQWRQRAAEVARRTASVVRNVDLSASLGPLEFAICLVQCDRTGAEIASQRIAVELSGYTCAIGVAVFPEDDFGAQALIELARGRAVVKTAPTEAA